MPPCQKQRKESLKGIHPEKNVYGFSLEPFAVSGFQPMLFNVNGDATDQKHRCKKKPGFTRLVKENKYYWLH